MRCGFLLGFLFHGAYERQAVPFGCRNCFKLKAVPNDLKGMVALLELLEKQPEHAKCGVDLNNAYSRDLYAGYVYLDGLDAARAAYAPLRQAIDRHPDLGPRVPLRIKRGCSDYEVFCGPSDSWDFANWQAAFEAHAEELCPPVHGDPLPYRLAKATRMTEWIKLAYRIGDDSYLAFTDGQPLYAASVSYSPESA